MSSQPPPAPRPRRILRLPAVMEMTGLKRDSIYRGARQGWFPRPVKLNERASGWLESEVEDYIDRCATLRDSASANTALPSEE